MRVAQLGLRTGVSIPTIKYYLREGLLPHGERTGPNQACYGDEHVRRLRMIKALTEVGGLSIAAVRYVLAALPTDQGERATMPPGDAWPAAEQHVKEVLAAGEWHADLDGDAGRTLVAAVATLHELGRADLAGILERCATVVADLIRADALVTDPEDAEARVLTLVLGDVMMAALRRLVTPRSPGIPLPGRPHPHPASTGER